MLNLSIFLVSLPMWTVGFVLLFVAKRVARQVEARLALATIPVEHKGK